MNQSNEHKLSFQYEALLRLVIQLHLNGELITVAKMLDHPQTLYTDRNTIDFALMSMAKRGFLIVERIKEEEGEREYKVFIPTEKGKEFLLRRDEVRRGLVEVFKWGDGVTVRQPSSQPPDYTY